MSKDRAGEVRLRGVRLSYASIFRPKSFGDESAAAKFSCAFLIHKQTGRANIEKVRAAIAEVARAKWGDDLPKLKPEKLCLRDGDDVDRDGYSDCMYLTASNAHRPSIVDRDLTPLVEEDGRPYSGCYVNAAIRIWAQDNKYGRRINARLEAVQFVRHGDAFGAKPVIAAEVFDDLDDETAGPPQIPSGNRLHDLL